MERNTSKPLGFALKRLSVRYYAKLSKEKVVKLNCKILSNKKEEKFGLNRSVCVFSQSSAAVGHERKKEKKEQTSPRCQKTLQCSFHVWHAKKPLLYSHIVS